MSVRDTLVLDHFYVDATPEEFEDLKAMLGFIPGGAIHSLVKTDDDQWEGLYFRSRPNSYFEILRDRRPGALGLAMTPYAPFEVETSRIVRDLPALPWTTYSRKTQDGQPWFDSYSLTPDQSSKETLFYAWIMDYRHRHVDWMHAPKRPRTIDQLTSLTVKIGRENREEIERLSAWLPIAPVEQDGTLVFSIPERDGYRFSIYMKLVEGDERFTWESINFKMYQAPAWSQFKLGRFIANANDRDVTLQRNEQR